MLGLSDILLCGRWLWIKSPCLAQRPKPVWLPAVFRVESAGLLTPAPLGVSRLIMSPPSCQRVFAPLSGFISSPNPDRFISLVTRTESRRKVAIRASILQQQTCPPPAPPPWLRLPAAGHSLFGAIWLPMSGPASSGDKVSGPGHIFTRTKSACCVDSSPTTLLVSGQQLDHGASPARRHARKCLPPARIPIPSLARSTGHGRTGAGRRRAYLRVLPSKAPAPRLKTPTGVVWMSSCFNAAVESKQRGRGPRTTTTWVLSSIQFTGGVQVHAPNYGHSANPAARSVPL
ncbi:hypothetical protein CDEST_01342 [Colletotrichum destructivum]|uniref:Uncharacterized protein n=1 Tax=Colletotrichum destructivum TaxID=34406 RepID=A0AAX4HZZ3_9PEZI|nr:hypothetical protein CDEST_01342 [Colletotrichum destructivum]